MSRARRFVVSASLLTVASTSFALVAPPDGAVLPDYDSRQSRESSSLAPKAHPDGANLESLFTARSGVPVRLTVDALRATPRTLRAAAPGVYLTPPSGDAAIDIARRFLNDNADAFGLTSAEVANLVLDTDDVTTTSGFRHLWLQQFVDGIPVHGGRIGVNLTRRGEVALINAGPYVAGLSLGDAEPAMPAETAVRLAADFANESFLASENPVLLATDSNARTMVFARGHLKSPIRAEQIFFPVEEGARLAWRVVVDSAQYPAMYEIFVDAASGELLLRWNLTNYFWTATAYRIHPEATPTRDVWDLSAAARAPESPNGWFDFVKFITLSNNVASHEDPSDFPTCGSPGPNGPYVEVPESFTWDFDFPIDLAQGPDTYIPAAITNLYIINNLIHDRLYEYGFTETAGNFQTDNFGRLPAGDGDKDAVSAEAQDHRACGAANNANFNTQPDGTLGRMQMYIWTSTTPARDGDLDSDVIIHEFCHGLSHRLVGGRTCTGSCALGSAQSGAMGESWGDIIGASYAGDDTVGEYSTGNPSGIRTRAGAFAASSLTLNNLGEFCQVHAEGEVWSRALWRIHDEFVNHYGPVDGPPRFERYIVEGLKLTPTVPNFLDARDAMTLAAQNRPSRIDECLMWTGFAVGGMGPAAQLSRDCPPSTKVEDFNIPAYCICSPGAPDVVPNSLKGARTGLGRWDWTWQTTGAGTWNVHQTTTKSLIPNLWMDPTTWVRPATTSPVTDVGDMPPGFYQVFGADGCSGESAP